MKHFGNSLSFEDILEDERINNPIPVKLKGTVTDVIKVGNYVNGIFIQTGTRERIKEITLTEINGMFTLKSNYDSGVFKTIDQAKRRAKYLFGNVKWSKFYPTPKVKEICQHSR